MITIDLPAPISTNQLRRINWAAKKKHEAWVKLAEGMVWAQWRDIKKARMLGQFEMTILLPKKSRIDPDNIKIIPDFLKRVGLIIDDSKKYIRKITIIPDAVEDGCQVILNPV